MTDTDDYVIPPLPEIIKKAAILRHTLYMYRISHSKKKKTDFFLISERTAKNKPIPVQQNVTDISGMTILSKLTDQDEQVSSVWHAT